MIDAWFSSLRYLEIMKHIMRIFIKYDFSNDEFIEIPEYHYNHIVSVMRLKKDDEIIIFNSIAGEYRASLYIIDKKKIVVRKGEYIRSSSTRENNVRKSLAIGIIKFDNMKMIVEKITELGCTDVYPVIMEYSSNLNQFKKDKLEIISIMSSEQSERMTIPLIHDPIKFSDFMNKYLLKDDTRWFSAIERLDGEEDRKNFMKFDDERQDIGFIIGPEGGFSSYERDIRMKSTKKISLSKNILRSETAAISCFSILSYFS